MARAVSHGSMVGAGTGAVTGAMLSGNGSSRSNPQKDKRTFSRSNTSSSFGNRAGSKVGAVLDTKNKVKDKANAVKESIKDMPTQTAYAVYSAKERQSPACPTLSVEWFRNSSPDRRDDWKSRNSIDKISLTSVWSFKRHKKQGRHERRTDQRQRELPRPP